MQHLDEGIIHAWIDGELAPDEASRVEAHARSCASCGAMVAEARGLVAASSRIVSALDVTPGNVLPAFGARKTPRRWSAARVGSAIAATLVIAAGTVMSVRGRVNTPVSVAEHDTTAVTTPSIAQPTANPRVSPPSAPTDSSSVARREDRPASGSVVAVAVAASAVAPQPPPAPQISTDVPSRSAVVGTAPVAGVLAAPQPDSSIRVAAAAQMDSLRLARSSLMMGKVAGGAGGGLGALGAAAASTRSARTSVAPERALAPVADVALAPGYAGCYELNESTDVLPRRFALRADSGHAGAGGLHEVRYVDSTGAVDGRIPDVGWMDTGGRAAIRTVGRGDVLTIFRAGDAVAAQSMLGPRTVRVTTCR